MNRPFSMAWCLSSVVLFCVVEAVIGGFLGPLIVGKYVSPMFDMQVQMILHLASFYLGGVLVGLISPGRRLLEPAVGAAIAVVCVFLMSVFLPTHFLVWQSGKVLVAGTIGFVIALAGAYSGEKFMGNVEADDPRANDFARGRLRSKLWNETDGLLVPKQSSDKTRV